MIAALIVALAIPWLTPLSFGLHAKGWHVGQSGTYHTVWCSQTCGARSTAWAANVRYRDSARSDPPNRTLEHRPADGVVVWASIQGCTMGWPSDHRRVNVHYALADAYRFPCCEAAAIGGGEWELYGFGPKRAYSVLVRIYWARRRPKR